MSESGIQELVVKLSHVDKRAGMCARRLAKHFGYRYSLQILVAATEHYALYTAFCQNGPRQFLTARDAFAAANADDMVIFVEQLHIYGVFRICDYESFIRELKNPLCDDDRADEYSICQLVLENKQQKLVFVSNNTSTDVIQKIRAYVKEYFNSDVYQRDNQFIVCEKTAVDYSQSAAAIDQLINHIVSKDATMCDVLFKNYLMTDAPYRFVKIPLPLDDIDDNQPSKYQVVIYNTVINGNNNTVINGDHNSVKFARPIDKTQIAKDWIKNNPPLERETTTDYYSRYAENTSDKVANTRFGPLVKDAGYKIVKGTNTRYWMV